MSQKIILLIFCSTILKRKKQKFLSCGLYENKLFGACQMQFAGPWLDRCSAICGSSTLCGWVGQGRFEHRFVTRTLQMKHYLLTKQITFLMYKLFFKCMYIQLKLVKHSHSSFKWFNEVVKQILIHLFLKTCFVLSLYTDSIVVLVFRTKLGTIRRIRMNVSPSLPQCQRQPCDWVLAKEM